MSNVEDLDRARLERAAPAVVDPYTTVPGAFTAARESGLVEMRDGLPVRTAKGEALYAKRRL